MSYTRKTCKRCRKPRPLPAKPVHKDVPMSTYTDDLYCTTECCKLDHGVVNSGVSHSTPTWRHGTWYGYAKMGCKCEECRAYVSSKRKQRRERAREQAA